MRLMLRSALTAFIIPALGLAVLAGCGKKGPPLPPLPVKGAVLEGHALHYAKLKSKGFVRLGALSSSGKEAFYLERDIKHRTYKGSI